MSEHKRGASAPFGNLTLQRRYTCGCAEYLDQRNELWTIAGVFCAATDTNGSPQPLPTHKQTIAQGHETQEDLFS